MKKVTRLRYWYYKNIKLICHENPGMEKIMSETIAYFSNINRIETAKKINVIQKWINES